MEQSATLQLLVQQKNELQAELQTELQTRARKRALDADCADSDVASQLEALDQHIEQQRSLLSQSTSACKVVETVLLARDLTAALAGADVSSQPPAHTTEVIEESESSQSSQAPIYRSFMAADDSDDETHKPVLRSLDAADAPLRVVTAPAVLTDATARAAVLAIAFERRRRHSVLHTATLALSAATAAGCHGSARAVVCS